MKESQKWLKNVSYILPRAALMLVFLIYAFISVLNYFDSFEPYLYPLRLAQAKTTVIGDNVITGPYPHHEDLKELKYRYKVDIIISLLNSDLPQEKALCEREKVESANIGLKVVNFPMDYWFIAAKTDQKENEKMLSEIIDLVKANPDKKFYVHCYLGRHRVGFVTDGLMENHVLARKP